MNFSAMSERRRSYGVKIGKVALGDQAPIIVQSMTNTDTANIEATSQQIMQLAQAGSELVRLTVNNDEAARAVPHIRDRLAALGCDVPLIGDFHYNGHTLLQTYPACAGALAKYRINPGNVGFHEKMDRNFSIMVEAALNHGKVIRIGVNWGSLDQAFLTRLMDENHLKSSPKDARQVMHDAMVGSALFSAQRAEQLGMPANHIVISAKCSEVQDLIAVYRLLAQQCHYALHLGLTEAGPGSRAIVASSAALSILLQEGIGDTLRISLTPEPGGERAREVIVAQEILQSLGLRAFTPMIIACPGCGRTTSERFQELAQDIQTYVRTRTVDWRQTYPGFESLQIAVMGCIVNGPGESKHADIGISLPGTGEMPAAPVYIDGKKFTTLRGEALAEQFKGIVENYVAKRWGH